eukprot:scaffold214064_cov38-Prasinocladus_malaysianus.AAC.1
MRVDSLNFLTSPGGDVTAATGRVGNLQAISMFHLSKQEPSKLMQWPLPPVSTYAPERFLLPNHAIFTAVLRTT